MKKTDPNYRKRHRHLYGSHRWRKLTRNFLTAHPLCVMCETEGRVSTATEVDHIKPHRGDVALFWDEDNLQALCAFHHRSVKAQMERSGKVRGSRADGLPLDPKHHWNS